MKKNITEVNNKDTQGISRRSFLSTTAMAGAGLILTPSLLFALGEQPNNNNQGDRKPNKKDNKMKTRKLGDLEVSVAIFNANSHNDHLVRKLVAI